MSKIDLSKLMTNKHNSHRNIRHYITDHLVYAIIKYTKPSGIYWSTQFVLYGDNGSCQYSTVSTNYDDAWKIIVGKYVKLLNGGIAEIIELNKLKPSMDVIEHYLRVESPKHYDGLPVEKLINKLYGK